MSNKEYKITPTFKYNLLLILSLFNTIILILCICYYYNIHNYIMATYDSIITIIWIKLSKLFYKNLKCAIDKEKYSNE